MTKTHSELTDADLDTVSAAAAIATLATPPAPSRACYLKYKLHR